MSIKHQLLLTGAALAASLAISAKPASAAVLWSTSFEDGSEAPTNSTNTTAEAHTGSHSALAHTAPNQNVSHFMAPSLPLPLLAPGETYDSFTLNIWIKQLDGAGGNYQAIVPFSGGNQAVSYAEVGTTTDWAKLTFDLTADANANYSAGGNIPYFGFLYNGDNKDGGALAEPAAYYIDDMSVEYTIVPEPASLSMLGVGGLMLMARRRRAF